MFLQRVAAIALRQFYLYRESPVRILSIFVWVAIDIVVWGFITRYLNSVASPGFSFVPALLGAALFWDFFNRVMHGVSTAFFEDVWSRNFLNLFATPLGIPEYLCGLVTASTLSSMFSLVIMLLLASIVFGLNFLIFGLHLIPFLLVLFLFGIALGIVGAGIVLRLGPSAEWLIWPMPAMLSPFAAVFYPLATLPAWMRVVGHLLPPAYVFEGMRAIVQGHPVSSASLLEGLLLALLHLGLACWFFSYVFREVIRSGLIARYSAESVA